MTKNSQIISSEAAALGLTVDIISYKDHLFTIKSKNHSMLVCELFSMTLDPNCEAYRLSKNKDLTYALWEKAGLPFPKYYHFKNPDEFKKQLPNLDLVFPLITKEGGGSKSVNVHMDIRSKEQLEFAAQSYSGKFIAQQMVTGKEYRLLIYKGRLLGALLMIPPHIVGNGIDTIQELITKANQSKEKKIRLTETVFATLGKAGRGLDDILMQDEVVLLQKNSRLSEGGESHDCTATVNPEIIALAWKAVQATNLSLGGIDLICDDITASPKGQNFMFLEVNTYPDLTIHYSPTHGQSQSVAKMILEDVFFKK